MPEKFSLKPGEDIVMKELAMLRVGKISSQMGKLILTNRRLVFAQKPNPFQTLLGGGLVGMLMGRRQNLLPLNASPSEITGIDRTTFGRAVCVVVRTADAEHQVMVSKKTIDKWVQAIESLRSSQG